jgi:hypothetical protein
MGFSRREYWSGFLFPPPGDFPNPETEPMSPALVGRFFTTEPPGKPKLCKLGVIIQKQGNKSVSKTTEVRNNLGDNVKSTV